MLVDYNNTSPLHSACQNSHISIEIIKYLVENKSDPNLITDNNNSSLHFICNNEKEYSSMATFNECWHSIHIKCLQDDLRCPCMEEA